KKSTQSFYKFVIERGNSRRSVIYGFSNELYRWNTFVGVPTSEVLKQVLSINPPFRQIIPDTPA
ncbi:hypothetical protein, partial [Leptospira borgpetersenii]|uniref:hypothetical protein n=1 Tax=Leptospira borgpetersenii TaxID=174 RepID=UPI001D1338F4